MAIANAVLHHLVENVQCKTLFITHYPLVATEIERRFPADVQNLHMGFTEDTCVDGTREITFLYRLAPGIASGSFGVECGRLAALPESILEQAAEQSRKMQNLVERRHKRARCVFPPPRSTSHTHMHARLIKCVGLMQKCIGDQAGGAIVQELQENVRGVIADQSTEH
jgi:DNA mismatch repair protein MSH3